MLNRNLNFLLSFSSGKIPRETTVWDSRRRLELRLAEKLSYAKSLLCESSHVTSPYFLATVVQTLNSAIHRTNHYPVDSAIDFRNTYPRDSAIQRLKNRGPEMHMKNASAKRDCLTRVCLTIGTLRSNDATAMRTSLKM